MCMAVLVAQVEYNQPLCSRCKFVALKTKSPHTLRLRAKSNSEEKSEKGK